MPSFKSACVCAMMHSQQMQGAMQGMSVHAFAASLFFCVCVSFCASAWTIVYTYLKLHVRLGMVSLGYNCVSKMPCNESA